MQKKITIVVIYTAGYKHFTNTFTHEKNSSFNFVTRLFPTNVLIYTGKRRKKILSKTKRKFVMYNIYLSMNFYTYEDNSGKKKKKGQKK